MRSTVIDLLRWQDALLSGRVVSRHGVQAMTTPGTLDDGDPLPGPPGAPRFGFGLLIGEENEHPVVFHAGVGQGLLRC